MRPTLEAQGLKESLLEYLSTTYALADEGAREALQRFLGDDSSGMFRGPFLRMRTPFLPAGPGWRDVLEWAPEGWSPYAHQAAAFARLSSAHGRTPQPTLITTGTGSGKTESFLFPVLDHCRRERAAGRRGVKALLLYPMNALATDQAQRIEGYLTRYAPDLGDLRTGLYIGERAATQYTRVLTRRSDMRLAPPDILITNYKMLDLLLQRSEDAPLWRGADIRYVVVDEFHTYDGAQGTDVAMLLRRLAAALGVPEPGRPLGAMCPVATSATLGSPPDDGGGRELLEVAGQVFGRVFAAEAIVGESRQDVGAFIPPRGLDPRLPLPTPEELVALPDPSLGDDALADLVECVTGTREPDPVTLGENLRRHIFTQAVIEALGDGVRSSAEVLDAMWRHGASSWGRAIVERPEVAAQALARFVALLSIARVKDADGDGRLRPFVHVEVHLWARSVSRLLRGVLPWPKAEFQWHQAEASDDSSGGADRSAPVTTATSGQRANLFLPAVYCRDCGRSGWAVFSPESDDAAVEFNPAKIRRASTSQDKIRVRNLIAATDEEARQARGDGAVTVSARGRRGGGGRSGEPGGQLQRGVGGVLMVLDGVRGRLRPPDALNDFDKTTGAPALTARDSAFVLVHLGPTANTAAADDWCPACGERNAVRYLGTGQAALAAASITRLFTGGELDRTAGEDRTLMFNDSVQDAAHRAGFVASRSYTFSLRALLTAHLSPTAPTALNDLIADVVAATTEPQTLAAVVPPDLHDLRGVGRLLSGAGRGGDLPTWRMVGERLAFETLTEFGFRSRNGRTLELTRTAAAHVHIPGPAAAIELVRAAHLESARGGDLVPAEQSDERYLAFLRVFLERLRSRGAMGHRWLRAYLGEAGTSRYFIWGRRPPGMRAFPRDVAAPVFLLSQPKEGSEFDVATGRLSWYERWAQRCLLLSREQAGAFWGRLLPELHAAGLLAMTVPKDSSLRVFGLRPGMVEARLLADEEVGVAYVRCPVCFWEQTVDPLLLSQWHGQPCPTYRCNGERSRLLAGDRMPVSGAGAQAHLRDRDYRRDYYRRLYRAAGTYQVITAEHTGVLTRPEREKVEEAFRNRSRFNDPNVLACTPTLELGIDIGELSAVVLASLPRTPANYVQRVGRAGRRTGNAFLLTIPERRRRDLYFLEQPKEMIAGRIVPPGCHLSAVEILRRQYLAHLLDLAACGRLHRADGRPLPALPHKAPKLFGPSGYLWDLVDAARARGEELAAGFLALFPDGPGGTGGVNERAADELRAFATTGLRGVAEEAERAWFGAEEVLRARLHAIGQAHDALHDTDPEEALQKAELDAESRGVGRRLMLLGDTPAQQALCDLGLLPNYALIDTRTTLAASLYWREGQGQERRGGEREGRPVFRSELREYERPRRFAISEFAPGNTFYARGHRHEITGLEIGTTHHPAWEAWRVCPGCGYVRTENAAADRSPCPRCHSQHIADDGSCLFNVVQPTQVTSRDRREDSRIRDDRDERDRRQYTVVEAVDLPEEAIEPGSWRHAHETFGIDFTRAARVRTINVGPARADASAADDFAGHTLRLNPFHVCSGCGAASADGRPVFDHDTDALSSSAARTPRLKHHRPWCPSRRGRRDGAAEIPVLLAHDLRTEALRVLLPAATVLVEEKIHSFRAALRLGVDRHFGGDPQHLATTLASMPDPATGERRWFLVLFDALPGGTGYLHRLTDPDAFRDTLAAAREALLTCPCNEEGRRACHRCLHHYTPEAHQDHVSRREALELIGTLLFGREGPDGEDGRPWATEPVRHTGQIGLDAQVESDLEARFLVLLRDWTGRRDDAVLDEEGRASGHLRFTGTPGVVHWRLTAQQRLSGTRTDFTFTRADGPAQSVKVYLDGHRYHATAEHNRLAQDAASRTLLRANGHVVFQITWDDLDLFEERQGGTSGNGRAEPVWPPYLGGAQEQAKAAYERYGGARAHFADAVFANPIATLLAYLRDPSPEVWARRARALVTGLTRAPGTVQQATADRRGDLVNAMGAALGPDAHATPAPEDGVAVGPAHVLRATDSSGLRLVVAIDARDPEPHALAWTTLAVLDDTTSALGTDAHKRLWRSWLYWSNLLQFLAHARGDGVQLTTSQLPGYPLEALTVCRPVPAPEAQLASMLRDTAWDEEIVPVLAEDGEADLAALATALADRGKRAPVFGYELGTSGWLADFAWDDSGVRVAVVPTPHTGGGTDDQEAERRDAAYRAAGWTVRTAAGWLAHLDSLLALLPDAEAARNAPHDTEGSVP